MLETCAQYSSEMTDEERELGFEMVEFQDRCQQVSTTQQLGTAVVYRLGERDRIAKLDIPFVGGNSYRRERLAQASSTSSQWIPVDSIVFPTAVQALDAISGFPRQLQYCQ